MKRPVLIRQLLLVLIASTCVTCNLPRDAEGTLERARGARVRVGLVENEPWVKRVNGEPAGVEVELVRRFAAQLNATPEWFWGNEQEHMEALKRFELDLVVGGITESTPWQKDVGLTNSYFENQIKVGVPRSSPLLENLKGVRVAAKQGEAVAAYLEEEDAIPVRVDDPSQVNGPVAASEWQLEQWGFAVTDMELHTEKHVMIVPPGENGWLARLEQFLHEQRTQVKGMLQQQGATKQ
ncbi:MAG: transporter substrate-binding domain-containing protein [Pyrinomonadaceae bacterium]|nr:transporter substrate-binding domain-containing protein [Pyrinomonadaceae bacterium]